MNPIGIALESNDSKIRRLEAENAALRAELAALKVRDVVMVPREPIDIMLYMMCRAINTKEERIDSYKEMIAAAPGVQAGEKGNAELKGGA